MNLPEYERMFEVEETQWWFVGMRALSFALLDGAARGGVAHGRKILDAGCGTGSNLKHLASRGSAVGIDIADEALRFCRARGVSVARAGLLGLPFPDACFDWVTSFDVLYHRWVTDDRLAMKELARVVRPGGLVLVRVPALKMLWGAHDEAVHSRHRYTRGEVVALLEQAGLVVERASYANTLLFPLVLARRAFDRLTGRHGSDISVLPAPLEWAFRSALLLESRILRHASLPLGASVFALGRKPQ